MRKWILIAVAAFLALSHQAKATTYDYVGQPFSQIDYNGLLCAECGGIGGILTFDSNTSNYSGTLFLTTSEAAEFGESDPFSGGGIWYNPPFSFFRPDVTSSVSGTFTFLNGSITSWSLNGITDGQIFVYSFSSGPGGDSMSLFGAGVGTINGSNSEGGVWTEEVAPVPELSTWTMMILGFLGLGCMVYRKKTRIAQMTIQ